jgi:hypothetical protein
MRVLLAEKLKHVEPVAESLPAQINLTVVLEILSDANDMMEKQIAELELAVDHDVVDGRLAIADGSVFDYRRLSVRRRKGIWSMVLQILPDWGDTGPVSRMD